MEQLKLHLVATCNLPDKISEDFEIQIGQKIGTVGMAIPGTDIKK